MAEESINIIKQEEGDEFFVGHNGGVALYGNKEQPALQHQHQGLVLHETVKPLVHMVCWDEEAQVDVQVSGRVTLVGDEKAPLPVTMTHHFANVHEQTMELKPFDHMMRVETKLAEPIHHALQMRTPLELRFCNPWQVDSDYTVALTVGGRPFIGIRLTGSTVAAPQPCTEERKPPLRIHATVPTTHV